MELHPLTHPQRRIWNVEQSHPGTSMWNNAGTLKIKGTLDFDALDKALQLFLEANDSLRLRIHMENGEPRQYVAPYQPVYIEKLDFTEAGLKGLYEWDARQTQAPMPLIDSPLYYFALAKTAPDEGCVYAKMHHIISDGISFVLFANEVMENYDRIIDGLEPVTQERTSYLAYVAEEQSYVESRRYAYDEEYWLKTFADYPEPTFLKQRASGYFDTKAKRKACVLDEDVSTAVRDFCAEQRISPFCLLLAAFSVYLSRVTGKHDIVLGAPVSNRTFAGASERFGMYVSTVPLRIRVDDEASFGEFLQKVTELWFSVLKHQRYPYDLLSEKVHASNHDAEPLYDLSLSYQIGTFVKDQKHFSYEGRWHFSGHQAMSFALHLNDRESSGRFILDYDYQTPLFNAKAIDFVNEHLRNILVDAIGNADRRLHELKLLPDDEYRKVTAGFNDTDDSRPRTTLTELWRQRLEADPEGEAMVHHGVSWSARELDDASSGFAHRLIESGIAPGDTVALMLPRSDSYLIALLGVLKAGAAFLPIEPSTPAERVAYMLEEARIPLVVGTGGDALPHGTATIAAPPADDRDPASKSADLPCPAPDDAAYIIYTSGSTGTPKGVVIEHHSIAHFAFAMRDVWGRSPGGRMLCAGPTCFDLNIMEICIGLLGGRVLVIADDREADYPERLCDLVIDERIDAMMVTPGRMQLLLSAGDAAKALRGFREIGLGADALPTSLLKRIHDLTDSHITNFYGPTEAAIAATACDLTDASEVTIGRPLPGCHVYILDPHGNPVPIGVPGELFIGGAGVGRGYLARPELSAERFVASPLDPNERLYRTGDLARWYPLGEIQLLGRIDQQVKIRGYRVEMGEVESRLLEIPGIVDAVVICRDGDDGHRYLCGYVTGNEAPSPSRTKEHLASVLPFYMIPASIVRLDSLPLTVNGKLDRKALPDPADMPAGIFDLDELPRTETERRLAVIWQDMLKAPSVERSAHFLEIGGDSLTMVRMISEAADEFDVELSLEDVYAQPTLAHCAELIEHARRSFRKPIKPVARRKAYPATPTQRRMFAVTRRDPGSLAYNVPCAFVFDQRLDVARLKAALRTLIERHAVLRTSFVLDRASMMQHVATSFGLPFTLVKGDDADLDRLIEDSVRPFDLAKAPLMRLILVRTPSHDALLFDFHHAVCDQAAFESVLDDFSVLYQGGDLPPLAVDYPDCSVWLDDFLSSEAMEAQRGWWKEKLSPPVDPLDLPHKGKRTGRMRGKSKAARIPSARLESLRAFVQDEGATTFPALLAAFALVLSRQAGQGEVVVGTPVAGRTSTAMQRVVGAFINMLPLRCDPSDDATVRSYFEDVNRAFAGALAHQDYPFDRMVADCGCPGEMNRNPLFDAMLVTGKRMPSLSLGDEAAKARTVSTGTAKLDMTLFAYETPDGLECLLEYDSDLFAAKSAERTLKRIAYVFETLFRDPELPLRDACILPPDELALVTDAFSDTDRSFPFHTLPDHVRTFARTDPGRIAVSASGESIDFTTFDRRANLVANALIGRGIGRGSIVGVMMHRTIDLLPALFGVMKAGAAYLPIDPSYPPDRRTFMLQDSAVESVLADDGTLGTALLCPVGAQGALDPKGAERISLDIAAAKPSALADPEADIAPEDIAYLIYTSGSTGTPKASMLSWAAMSNLMEAMRESVGYRESWSCASITTISFDIFVADALLPLCNGCSVVLADEEELRQPHLLARLMERESVDFLQATPSRMQIMLGDESFRRVARRLSCVVLAGEKPALSLVRTMKRLFPTTMLKNGYGPSEVTVYTSFQDFRASDRVSIGRPLANIHIYLLDEHDRPVPIGTPGEACISGIGVSLGYRGREDLNATRFAPDPFRPGLTMYRSGDLCFFSESGEIFICGRIDHQVKIRGQRVEPGEIEARLLAFPGIREAVVTAVGEGEKRALCAHYAADGVVDEKKLRRALADKLPAHMVPPFFVELESLPMTANGKVDRSLLPAPGRTARAHAGDEAGRARDREAAPDERRFLRVVGNVLEVSDISLDDDFFELGGDSLGIIAVQARMMKHGWSMRTQDFYDVGVLGGIFARAVKAEDASGGDGSGTGRSARRRGAADDPASRAARRDRRNAVAAVVEPLPPVSLDRVLLTGATGFLGAHLAVALQAAGAQDIVCLVKAATDEEAQRRLDNILELHFDGGRPRVRALHGDLASLESRLADLADTTCIFHAAALTEHVGRRRDFNRANVEGTRHAIAAARRLACPLVHISTLSIGGQGDGILDEASFDLGQDVSFNEYARSKFLAEGAVLDACDQGLDGRIMRVGNLTGRLSDGGFQLDVHRNAFAMRLAALITLGCYPEGLFTPVDITPVDICARDVVAIAASGSSTRRIAHLRNGNLLGMDDLAALAMQAGHPLEGMDSAAFAQRALEHSADDFAGVFGLVRDLAETEDGGMAPVSSDATDALLESIGMPWPRITAPYLSAYVAHVLPQDDRP